MATKTSENNRIFNKLKTQIINENTISFYEKAINILQKVKEILKEIGDYNDVVQDVDWIAQNINKKSLFDIDFQENDFLDNLSISNMNKVDKIELFQIIKNHTLNSHEFSGKQIKTGESKSNVNNSKKELQNALISPIKLTKLTTQSKSVERLNKSLINSTKQINLFIDEFSDEDEEEIKKSSDENNYVYNEFIPKSGSTIQNLYEIESKTLEYNVIKESINKTLSTKLIKSRLDIFSKRKGRNSTINKFERKIIRGFSNQSPRIKSRIKIDDLLENSLRISSMEFNIFDFSKNVGRKNTMNIIFHEIMYNVCKENSIELNFTKLKIFTNKINTGYNQQNSYHNELHGSDVCQTVYSWMKVTKLEYLIYIEPYEHLAFLTASLIHDYKHPGYNNAYMTNTMSDLAIIYNDKSILENMHIAEAFKVLLNPECNIFENYSTNEFKIIRKRMIETVLHTDMSYHFSTFSIIKNKLLHIGLNGENKLKELVDLKSKNLFDEQQEILNFIMHSADISHNSKDWKISKKWSSLVYKEFFNQGDMELEQDLPYSMFCDRNTTNIPKAQIGFIVGIIAPNFELLSKLFSELSKLSQNLEENRNKWEELLEKENK